MEKKFIDLQKRKGFIGDWKNSEEVIYYEKHVGDELIETIKNIDGSKFNIYEDNNIALVPKIVLASIFPDKETQESVLKFIRQYDIAQQNRDKFCIGSVLGISGYDVLKIEWHKIDELIFADYKKRLPVKVYGAILRK